MPLGSPKQRALLGLLLVHANEPVARDRLIEGLWASAAPRTVNAVLSVYLSRLRRLLADGTGEQLLLTQPAGYVLRVPPDQLDAHRFEDLLELGRRTLASGEAERASRTLREALALWRGPPLADLAFEPFAQAEIARLGELRLTALEARIDADLALGRHDSLVAELESLVAAHAYREGLRAQLMVALYRSGRQAEALEAYGRARRTLAQELGIDPGPRLQELEKAILRQDSTLDAPHDEPRVREAGPIETARRRRPGARSAAMLATALVLVIAAALAAAARGLLGHSAAPVTLEGDSIAVVDPETNTIVAEIPVGETPVGPAVGAGSVWVGNRDDQTLLRIDPGSREVVRTIGIGVTPIDVEVGAGGVWVLSDQALLRVDPAVNGVVARIPLPGTTRLGRWNGMEVSPNGVYLCRCGPIPGRNFARIDPVTNDVTYLRVGPVFRATYGGGALWAQVGYEADRIVRIDPETNAVVAVIPLDRIGELHGYGYRLAIGDDAVWLASRQSLWRLDPATNRLLGSIPLGGAAQVTASAGNAEGSLAAGYGAVWVASFGHGLLRVDPESRTVAKPIPLGTLIYPAGTDAMAVGEGAVWLAVTSYAS